MGIIGVYLRATVVASCQARSHSVGVLPSVSSGHAQLAALTLLSPGILHKIDEGRFTELPGGLYARSYIRAFASVVGLDPEDVVRELGERLPPAENPLPALREIARSGDPAWMAAFNGFALSARTWMASATAGWTGINPGVESAFNPRINRPTEAPPTTPGGHWPTRG